MSCLKKYKLLQNGRYSLHPSKEPKGLGHAVWCARKFIGDEPFAVLLGDDIVQAEKPCLRQLMDEYEKHFLLLLVYKLFQSRKHIAMELLIH